MNSPTSLYHDVYRIPLESQKELLQFVEFGLDSDFKKKKIEDYFFINSKKVYYIGKKEFHLQIFNASQSNPMLVICYDHVPDLFMMRDLKELLKKDLKEDYREIKSFYNILQRFYYNQDSDYCAAFSYSYSSSSIDKVSLFCIFE